MYNKFYVSHQYNLVNTGDDYNLLWYNSHDKCLEIIDEIISKYPEKLI